MHTVTNCLSCQPMAIESLYLFIIVIGCAQISLLLITDIFAVEYLWLLINAVEFIDCQDHNIGIRFAFLMQQCRKMDFKAIESELACYFYSDPVEQN